MKSPSYHNFSQVPSVQIPRSAFDLSCRYKTAFDSGKLVPCMAPIEILPGDSIDLSLTAFARLSTPICPIMDNIQIDFHFFFVPNRLVWTNWQRFMGEQDDPGDSIDYVVPTIGTSISADQKIAVGSLGDYFGLPTGVSILTTDGQVCAFPWRAYNLIWNEFYRPEQLANSATVNKGDGPDDPGDYVLLPRYNRLDYFQGALPAPQKGAGVNLPLGGTAPVYGNGEPLGIKTNIDTSGQAVYYSNSVGHFLCNFNSGADDYQLKVAEKTDEFDSGLVADLSGATAATINSLRQAFQVQLFLERENLGGSRYTELLRSMFGVISPDARLQRPEFLGGGTLDVHISSVPQTSSTDSTSPQGNLAAFGLTKGHLPHIKKSFVEHGYLLGLMSVRSPITYQQGIDRHWSRKTRFDYYWPVFAHLGEQAILNKEIFAQGTSDDEGVFGYQERYAEYRYGVSHVTGKLRSTSATPLDMWHLGIKYDSLPELGDAFAQVNIPLSRVLAIKDEPQFIYDSLISCKMIRPMPLYGQPGRIDHFF